VDSVAQSALRTWIVTQTETAGLPETPLVGGDVTEGLVPVGDTVRRPVGPYSPLVHALPAHLESAGFDGALRFLGSDSRGRAVRGCVDGEVPDHDHRLRGAITGKGSPSPTWRNTPE
jgi:hypothetical protein